MLVVRLQELLGAALNQVIRIIVADRKDRVLLPLMFLLLHLTSLEVVATALCTLPGVSGSLRHEVGMVIIEFSCWSLRLLFFFKLISEAVWRTLPLNGHMLELVSPRLPLLILLVHLRLASSVFSARLRKASPVIKASLFNSLLIVATIIEGPLAR